MQNNNIRQTILSGLFIALGLILPSIFHMFGGAGPALLPMHLPVLMAALVLSPTYAILVGLLTPLFSSLLTGMPPMYPMVIIMSLELATYGGVLAYLVRRRHMNVYLSLIIAMILGRLVAGLVVAVLAAGFGLPMKPLEFIIGAFTTGILGIVIQLFVIPAFDFILKKYLPNYHEVNSKEA